MAEEKEEGIAFEIDSNAKGQKSALAVKNFDETKKQAQLILDTYKVPVIQSEDDFKKAKKIRAAYNHCIKAVNDKRISTIDEFTSDFTAQCKEIADMFKAREQEFKAAITAWDEQHKIVADKQAKITVTIKFYDPKLVEKLKKFALDHNCDFSVK